MCGAHACLSYVLCDLYIGLDIGILPALVLLYVFVLVLFDVIVLVCVCVVHVCSSVCDVVCVRASGRDVTSARGCAT